MARRGEAGRGGARADNSGKASSLPSVFNFGKQNGRNETITPLEAGRQRAD